MDTFKISLTCASLLLFVGCGGGDSGSSTNTSSVSTLPIIKTGQTVSYDSSGVPVAYGSIKDDGYYQTGLPRSYTRDDGNETVTDNSTGLMWQDDAAVYSVTKQWSTTENYDLGDYENTSGDTAATYCTDLVLGVYTDWRLPRHIELLSIADKSTLDPAIDPAFLNTYSGVYWSSTTNVAAPNTAWTVFFYDGNDGVGLKNAVNVGHVRCVRGGQ